MSRRYRLRAPCLPSSMFKRSSTIRMVKTAAVAAPPVVTRGGVERLWIAISKVLSVSHLSLTPLTLHATQRRARRGSGQEERSYPLLDEAASRRKNPLPENTKM